MTDCQCSLERLTQASKELSDATGRACLPAQADVRQPKQLQEAVRKTIERFGRIDYVICGKCSLASEQRLNHSDMLHESKCRRSRELSRAYLRFI